MNFLDVFFHLVNWAGGPQLIQTDFDKALAEKAKKNVKKIHPRVLAAEIQREALKEVIPSIADDIADIEFTSIFFTLFPNFHPWGPQGSNFNPQGARGPNFDPKFYQNSKFYKKSKNLDF